MSNLATITNNILADSGIDDINVVVTNGSYSNPAWITSLAWTKITGVPANIVTGSGTNNTIAKFNSTGATIGNSNISDDGSGVIVTGGAVMTSGWNRNTILEAVYPVLVYNSNGSKWGGIGYDWSFGFVLWANANSSNVVSGTQVLSIANSGATTIANLAGSGTRMVVADANGLLSTQAIGSGSITGSGTTNYIPKFTGSTTIGNSQIFNDGNNVGINTSTGFNQISGTETTLKIVNTNAASLYLEVTGVRGYANFVGASGNMVWYDYTAGVDRMFLYSNGNFRVGTGSDNGARLQVNGSSLVVIDAARAANEDSVIRITNSSTGSSATAQFFASNGTTQTQFFHTGTTYSSTGVLSTPGTGGIYNTTSAGIALVAAGASGILRFATGGTTTRMTILENGNVGINQNTPTNLLHLSSSSATPSLRLGSTSAGFHYDIGRENATTGDFLINATFSGVSQGTYFRLAQSGGAATFISSVTARNATTSASVNPSIMGAGEMMSTGSQSGYFWENRSGGVTSNTNWYGWYNVSGINHLWNGSTNITSINGSNGNFGIGDTNPLQKLIVNGGSLLVNTGTAGNTSFRDIMIGGISGWSNNESHGIDAVYGSSGSPVTFSRIESHFNGVSGRIRFRNLFNNSAPQTSILMTIEGNGNVLIGDTSDNGAMLQVNGNIRAGNISAVTNTIGTVDIGFSGGGYSALGYNISYTSTSNVYQYKVNDTSWMLDLGNANLFRLRYAPSGVAGNTISYGNLLTINTSGTATFISGVRASNFAFNAYSGGGEWQIGSDAATGSGLYLYQTSFGYSVIISSSGAATFSSGVTAGGNIQGKKGTFGTTGIGTPSLLVSDNDQSNVRLRLQNTGSGNAWDLVGGLNASNNSDFSIYDVANNNTVLRIVPNSGNATFSSSVTAGGFFASGSNNFVRFTSTGTADWGTVIVGSAGGARTTLLVGQSGYSNGFTVEYTGSAMRYIFRDGNVGIGPISSFPNGESFLIQNSGVWNVTMGLSNTGTGGGQWNIFSTNNTFSQGGGRLLIYNTTAGTDAMVIDSSNRVGIGTNNPLAPIHANGGAAMTGGWNRTAMLQATYPVLAFNSNNTKWAGVGYDFSGSQAFIIWVNANSENVVTGTSALIIAGSGAATFSSSVTATSFFESSDSKIKTLLEDKLDYQAISNVTAKYYKKNGKVELGYFAQDFETLLPNAVSKNEDGLLNLSYREVHTAKIAYLEERIKQLEKKYENN